MERIRVPILYLEYREEGTVRRTLMEMGVSDKDIHIIDPSRDTWEQSRDTRLFMEKGDYIAVMNI